MILEIKNFGRKSLSVALLTLFSNFSYAETATSTPPSPKFDIHSYKLEGNTLLSAEEVAAAIAPYTGVNKDFSDIQRALEKIQELYNSKGFTSVSVILPEQELENGQVKFEALEQKLSNVSTEGAKHHSQENILGSLPSLKSGELPNSKAVARNLKLANENPSKQTVVLFKNNEETNGVDATVKVIDEKPWKAFATADNSGNQQTGYSRLGVGFQHYNVLNKDHRFSGQFITNSPTDKDLFDVKIFGFGYSVPLYNLGDSLDFTLGYSDVNAGTIGLPGSNTGISVTGRGVVAGAKYNHNFNKINNYQHRISAGLDYRAYRNQVDFLGISLQPPVTATPISLTYSGLWQASEESLGFNLTSAWNAPFTSYSSGDTYDFYQSDRYFSKILYSVDYNRPFIKDWRIRFGMAGQITEDHLIAGEQFGAGGMDSVRGFRDRVVAGDKGYRWVVEAMSPDFGKILGDKVGLRSVFFYDGAHVTQEPDRFGFSSPEVNIASVGGGLRLLYAKDFVARMDYAMVVDGDKTSTTGTRQDGDLYMHISMGWIW